MVAEAAEDRATFAFQAIFTGFLTAGLSSANLAEAAEAATGLEDVPSLEDDKKYVGKAVGYGGDETEAWEVSERGLASSRCMVEVYDWEDCGYGISQ